MGDPPQSPLDSPNLKDMILSSNESKILQVQRTTFSQTRKNKRVLTRRRKRGVNDRAGSKRREIKIEKRVQTLKKLIPNRHSKGLEGLFKDTAAYIVALQMRARVMQIMVDMLTISQNQQ